MDIELSGSVLDGRVYAVLDDTIQEYQNYWLGHGLLIYRRTSRMHNDRVVFEFDRVDKNG